MSTERDTAMRRHPAGKARDPITTAQEFDPRYGSSNWPEYLTYGLVTIAAAAVLMLVIVAYLGGA